MYTNTRKKEVIDEMQEKVKGRLPRKRLHRLSLAELSFNLLSLNLAVLNGEKSASIIEFPALKEL